MISGVRNFKLINKNGQEYDLTRPGSLLINPTGLGWGKNSTITRVGMSFIEEDEQEDQYNPSGEIVFNSYEEYDNFLNFCFVGGIVFGYMPLNKWRFLKVNVAVDKEEIKPDTDRLICPVSFTGLSYWYEQLEYETGAPSVEGGKIYTYRYPYRYGATRQNIFEFNLGQPSYFKMQIMGEALNPEWRLSVNGEVTHTGKINANIIVGHKLIVNTDPNPEEMEISEYTNEDIFVTDRYKDSDFSTARIFRLPAGMSVLTVTSETTTIPNVFIEVKRHV